MKTLYDFYMSLNPGDVITSSGCTGVAKKNEQILTENRDHHARWGKYARIIDTEPELASGDIRGEDSSIVGVRWEGIDPNMKDVFVHVAYKKDKQPANLRKASKSERRVFMSEYLKTRFEIVNHEIEEAKDTVKRARRSSKALSKIAKDESINMNDLLKK